MYRIVFFGTPRFAVPALEALIAAPDIEISAVVTQPDRPAGRGKHLTAPPVKTSALAAGLSVHQPAGVRKAEFSDWCAQFSPDYLVVVAYGRILPKTLLAVPRLGCVNLHSSLLPKYRGAAPINWALVRGERETGVTTMLMDEGMDTGPVLQQESCAIEPQETAGELTERLAILGAPLLLNSLRAYAAGAIEPQPQDHDSATYAPIIAKEDGVIDWTLPAAQVLNRWRGFTPWPGVHTWLRGEVLKLTRLAPVQLTGNEKPGTLLVSGRSLLVVCGDGAALEIMEAQMTGKKPVRGSDLINGLRLKSGERLQS
jgi:methionyl-tRNA formyltransferase